MYTKTDLVFGFSKNQILVAVIPGLKNAEYKNKFSKNSNNVNPGIN